MSTIKLAALVKNTFLFAATALLLGGCSYYDYLQNTDRVAYSTGNALKANLEGQTINPSSANMYDVSGLGKDGYVIDPGTGEPATP